MTQQAARLTRALFAAMMLVSFAPAARTAAAQKAAIVAFDPASAPMAFAAGDIGAALVRRGYAVQTVPLAGATSSTAMTVVLATAGDRVPGAPSAAGLEPQGYVVRKTGSGDRARWTVVGADASGAMYGGLELAEDLDLDRLAPAATDRRVSPAIASRGIKFNIPLDARTPSYSDDSTSAQANIPEMWDMGFWTRFLDEMARHRYNLLSLWSLSPFPSLVKVPEYPNVALADVKRKAGPIWDATLQGRNMYDPGWTLETVKTMTMDQKIAFWRGVMQYARDRGVDVSLFTWNIFVYGTEASGYPITDSPANATTRDYVRRSVRAMFDTYPLLASMGVTSGENMGGLDDAGKEQWMWDSYGQGVRDAMADAKDPANPAYNPSRVIRLIHRAHQADLSKIVALFKQLPGYDAVPSSLAFSFKYSQAHMYSSTTPKFIYQNGWFDTIPAGKQTWLTVRNDDMYYLRWGDPDFVRAYLTHLPERSKIAGFYMGPDGYTWGREFVSKTPASPRPLVIDRQWYSFLLWGRLAYEPALSNERLQAVVGARFPGVAAPALFGAWQHASRILPLLTRFYWGSLDYMWYPEACWSSTGFASVDDFIRPKYRPMQPDEDGDTPHIMSVREWVDGAVADGRLSPLDVAASLEADARAAEQTVPAATSRDAELEATVADIRAMAALGRYYAEKVRGAVDLARFRKTNNTSDQASARAHLVAAASHWRDYAAIWSAHYVPQVLTRMGSAPVDIAAVQKYVDEDVSRTDH
jgi:hypothetical protein